MADRVLQRRDTEARWEAANPVLAEGELGIITDTKGYKIGDGVTAWNDLPYPSNPTQVVDTLGDTLNAVSQRLLTSLFSEGYLYAGVATPTTNPGTPEGHVFYLAIEQGYYPNFDNIQIQQYREICVFKWDGASWTKDILVEFHETAFIKGGEYVSYGDNYILAQAQTIFGGTNYPEDNLMLSAATTTTAGVMSAADKRNLESLKEYLLDNSKAETLPRDLLTTPPSVKPQSDKVTLGFSGVHQSSSDGYQDDMIEGEVDIPAATAEKAGVMTAEDKDNLDHLAHIASSGLGLKLGNHIHASDLFMGYYDGLFNMSVPSDVPNTTIERVFSKELGKYVLRAEISPGTTVPEGYKRTAIFTLNESYPEGTELYVSALFRLQTSNNYTNRYPTLIPLINGTWVDRYNGNLWTPFYAPDFTANSNDGKWHRLSFKIRATNGGAINKIDLSIYYGHGSDYINGGCVLELTDLYVGETDPGYSPAYNEDDLERPDVDLSGLVDNNAKGCVFMSLGDSITTEGYYIEKLRQLLQPSRFFNLAVAGATWADRSGTSSYDGNPLFQGDANQNVMGNQVQKIIDNPETYNADPDVIIMAAGTNDGTPVTADKSDYEVRVDVDSHFNSNSTTPIQVTEPTFDDSDTFKEHRKTIAGAMRYCVLKLQQMYPKARIYILTPIQGSYNPNKDYVTQIEVKQRYITEVAKHLATPVIHVGEECGINRDFEYGGTYWKSEYDPQSKNGGRDLVDGLHPNTNGGWKMANYIYRKIIEDYIPQYYE